VSVSFMRGLGRLTTAMVFLATGTMAEDARPRNEITIEIQESLETRAKAPIANFDSRNYTQHNLALGDGLRPILELMDALPAGRTTVTAHRSFVDGEYSVAHLDYVLGDWGPMVGFEIHRWEDGLIVEHWDNLQASVSWSQSGRADNG
jgi:predicted SnoaL-like aldol condensation-catalyzing enzyme